MGNTLEERLSMLEEFVASQNMVQMILINLVLQQDAQMRSKVAEALRHMLVAELPQPLPLPVQHALRSLRDTLLAPPSPDIAEAMLGTRLRSVD